MSLRKHPLYEPILLAILLHLLAVEAALFIRMPGLAVIAERVSRQFHVQTIVLKPQAPRKQGVIYTRQPLETLKFVDEAKTAQAKPIQEVPLGPLLGKKEAAYQYPVDAIPTADETVEEESQLKEMVGPKEKSAPGLLSRFSQKVVEESSLDAPGIPNLPVSVNPEEGMPGFTPTGQGAEGDMPPVFEPLRDEEKEALRYETLDDLLDIAVFTYEHPPTGEKYYMIKIFAKKGKPAFEPLAKEVIFTVDASLSISPERLEEFKEGIRYCLNHLNKDDLFNIIVFRDQPEFFSKLSVPPDPVTVKEALRYVSAMTSNRRTDVYVPFQKIVGLPLLRHPSNVLLISDGRPTHGIVDARELINSIARVNQKVRPVFVYSGGAKVNRYILDFIAYQNRGWSEYVRSISEIDEGLARFYDKIRDPLFLDLRYRLNGLNEPEAFPKSLPDFYRGAEFVLYGSYTDEDQFAMQLLGDVKGQTKELIFARSLKEAQKGGPEIMQGYAFNKIYYLINRLTEEGSNPALLYEIQSLSRRYGITTPYSPELETLD
ncbi:MAG: hypothetical protein ACREH5_01940 [Candidatus Omnitrophota bacterium]